MKNILIATPTLGERESLLQTIVSVAQFGASVRNIIVCPAGRVASLRRLVDPQSEVVSETRRTGVYGAVNDVLLQTDIECDWVGYINDDDYWLDGMGELLKRSQTTDADILYGRVEFVDWYGKHIAYSSSTRYYKIFPYLASHGVYIFTQQAVLIRRSLFSRLGGFDEQYKIQADNDLWVRAIKSGVKCEYLDNVCAAYRVHENQLTAGNSGLVERQRMLLLNNLSTKTVASRLALSFYRLANAPMYLGRIARGTRSVRAEAKR